MGPKLVSKRSEKTGILYSLRLLPIGGYVAMVGEDEESDNPNAFCNKKVWQRIIISAAGSAVNIAAGVILMLCFILASSAIGSTVIAEFNENAISSSCGLELGDRIIEINGKKTPIWNNVIYEISRDGTEPMDFLVVRDGEKTVIEDVRFGIESEDGIDYGELDFKVKREEKSFVNVIKHTLHGSLLTVRMIWESLFDLISGRIGFESVSGPVGVTTTIGNAAKTGLYSLLYLCSIIAMNLGIFNLLPLPALDGGRIFFQLIELIRGRPVNRKYEGMIHLAGILLLLLFMLLITIKDINGLIN